MFDEIKKILDGYFLLFIHLLKKDVENKLKI